MSVLTSMLLSQPRPNLCPNLTPFVINLGLYGLYLRSYMHVSSTYQRKGWRFGWDRWDRVRHPEVRMTALLTLNEHLEASATLSIIERRVSGASDAASEVRRLLPQHRSATPRRWSLSSAPRRIRRA